MSKTGTGTVLVVGPAGLGAQPIVMIHGGGWRNEDNNKLDPVTGKKIPNPPVVGAGVGTKGPTLAECEAEEGNIQLPTQFQRLRAAGFCVFDVFYELEQLPTESETGELNPAFPKQPEQCREAIKWVYENCERFGADPKKLVVVGFSAGAHLAMIAAQKFNTERGTNAVKAVASMSGPTDIVKLSEELYNALTWNPSVENPEWTTEGSQLSTSLAMAISEPAGKRSKEGLKPPLEAGPKKIAEEWSPLLHIDSHCPAIIMWEGQYWEYIPQDHATVMKAALEAAGIETGYNIVPNGTAKLEKNKEKGHAQGYWLSPGPSGKTVEEEALAVFRSFP